MDKLQPYFQGVFRIVVVLYTCVSGFYFLGRPAGYGDEKLFLSDLSLIASQGWEVAIAKGISIPYMMLTFLPAQILEPHIALRWVNVLLLLLLEVYFYVYRNIKSFDFFGMLLFFISTVGYFFAGINDTLLIVLAVVFFSETYFLTFTSTKKKLMLWALVLVLMLFTRVLAFVFVPVILFSIFLVIKKRGFKIKSLIPAFIALIVMILVNVPSLRSNGTLSYDKKDPPKDVTATWAQRQYLAQLMVNEGSLANHSHPSWKETENYLKTNGVASLPSGILSGVTFDVGLTIKEFFKDFGEALVYGFRQLGFILPFMLVFGLNQFRKNKTIDKDTYIPILLIAMLCIFSLIIISYIELRWLGAVFIMSILGFWILQKENRLPKYLLNIHYATLSLLSVYGVYGLITKLISE